MEINYPSTIKGGVIGVTAPSSGISEPSDFARFELIKAQFQKAGFSIKEGACLRNDIKHVSGSASDRTQDLHNLWIDPSVKAIIPPWGGELLMETLPLINYELFKKNPKWILGYSDTSTLLFALTLKTHVATAHGSNLMDLIDGQVFDVKKTHLSALAAGRGYEFVQESYPKYQEKWIKWEEKVDGLFNVTEPVKWKSLRNNEHEKFSGRLIGGCLDTLVHLVGTPFGDLPRFVSEFSADGVVLYLENCEFSPSHLARALWQMRNANWFRNLKGLVFGRSAATEVTNPNALSHFEAVDSILGDLSIPVILDADIGHKPPQMILINGAYSTWELNGDSGRVTQIFK